MSINVAVRLGYKEEKGREKPECVAHSPVDNNCPLLQGL